MDPCKNLKISPDGRFITKEDGSPFFWLADTAWELFHRLTREEALEYLSIRAGQGFTVIQAVALAEFYGLTLPNAYGRTPLLKNDNGDFDPTLPDDGKEYSYWDHMDFIIEAAGSLGCMSGCSRHGVLISIRNGGTTPCCSRRRTRIYTGNGSAIGIKAVITSYGSWAATDRLRPKHTGRLSAAWRKA